mmetsp:Transcript_8449/g.5997  ORF Transcript_8449/g.5997 Transcript_8449/m.5997 type:complete len:110 (-) Transcript_8449:836-1165(-)
MYGLIFFCVFETAFTLSYLCHSFSWFYALSILSRIFAGIGEGLIISACYSIPSTQLPLERDIYIGLIQVFDLFGVVIGMAYTSLFSLFLDFPAVMYITIAQVLIFIPIG